VQEIPVVMFVTEMSISKHGAKKVFVGDDDMLYVIHVFMKKCSGFRICQIMSIFFADDEPLTGSIQVGAMYLFSKWGKFIDPMEAIVAFNKVVPYLRWGNYRFEYNVQEIGVFREVCKRISNPSANGNRFE
jgi:hypothetical protein